MGVEGMGKMDRRRKNEVLAHLEFLKTPNSLLQFGEKTIGGIRSAFPGPCSLGEVKNPVRWDQKFCPNNMIRWT